MANYNSNYTGQDLDESIKLSKGSIAEEFSTSKTYVLGDVVKKEGILYCCTNQSGHSGAWVAENWGDCNLSLVSLNILKATVAGAHFDNQAISKAELAQGLDLTNYEIAGYKLYDQNVITAAQLSSALSVNNLVVPQQNVSGTISGVIGSLTGDLQYQTISKQGSTSYTPTGVVTVKNQISDVTVASSLDSTQSSDPDATQISGTISKPTVTVTPTPQTIQSVTDVGTAASWTGASYTAPELSKASSSVSVPGWTIAIDENDDSILNITSGSVSSVATFLTDANMTAGSVDFGTFNGGSAPTVESLSVVGEVTVDVSQPTFTGSYYKVSSTPNITKADQGYNLVGSEATITYDYEYEKTNKGTLASSVDLTQAAAAITLPKTSVINDVTE